MLPSLVIYIYILPFFFFFFFFFPTATTLLMCFDMKTTLRQVVYIGVR